MPKKTVGKFRDLINENRDVFRKHFGVDLFPGSLNVDVPEPRTLQDDLGLGKYRPALVIPRSELKGMPAYIGDGQALRCKLQSTKMTGPVDCWIFRRIGSRVRKAVIEIVAEEALADTFGLRDGDSVTLRFFEGPNRD